jgi:AraC family transcriptional regulator, transcriptional activator of pobA
MLIYNESMNNLPNSNIMIQSEINLFMLELVRMECHEKARLTIPDILIKYKTLIEKQFQTYRQVKYYAMQLGITPNYLNILAQKHLGESALSLINNRIILEIKRQLTNSNDDISVIAYKLKFNELSYFSRFFKRDTGLTPNEFRTKMNKMYQ